MTRHLWVIEVNGEPLDQGAFTLIDDAYEVADEARQEVKPTDVVTIVKYVPAKEEVN